jgi:hypothetical protein
MPPEPETYAPMGPFCLTPEGLKKALIDPYGGMISMNRNHHEVHEGHFYTFGRTFLAVADDATVRVRFLTSANKEFHYGVEITAEGKALVKELEGTTYTDNGTEITPVNNNRSSSSVAELTAYHTPTVDVAGDELTPGNGILLVGGLGPNSIGGDIKPGEEFIAKVSTDYVIEVQNKSGQAKDITIEIAGYEETPL